MDEPKQYEYRVDSFGAFLSHGKDIDLQTKLDDWGAEGWEVVSIYPLENTFKARIIAKRALTQMVRRQRSRPGNLTDY